MHIPYDPDFDERPAHKPAAPLAQTSHGQSWFDAFSGSAAFGIGFVTAFLAAASIGFFVLLTLIL